MKIFAAVMLALLVGVLFVMGGVLIYQKMRLRKLARAKAKKEVKEKK